MNPEELQKNISLYYSKLSPEVQKVFSDMEWLETIKRIALEYKLNDKQVETLGTETTLVLLGVIHPNDYEKIVQNELELSDETTRGVFSEIDSLILNPIRAKLIDAFHINNDTEGEGEEKLDERFRQLPEEIQNAIISSNYHEVLYGIAELQKLTVEQITTLEKLTTNTILGIIPPNKFEDSVQAELKLASERTKIIVNNINEQILKKIRKEVITPPGANANNMVTKTIINDDEMKVLHEAGIKINSPDLKTPELPAGPKPAPIPSVANKLAASFQTPAVTTAHVLDNLSKPASVTPPPAAYPPKADPYRINPDE